MGVCVWGIYLTHIFIVIQLYNFRDSIKYVQICLACIYAQVVCLNVYLCMFVYIHIYMYLYIKIVVLKHIYVCRCNQNM